ARPQPRRYGAPTPRHRAGRSERWRRRPRVDGCEPRAGPSPGDRRTGAAPPGDGSHRLGGHRPFGRGRDRVLASGALRRPSRNEGPRPARLDEQAALTEVFARAASFASERNSALIRSGHLLLAIAASDSVGGNVLKAVGATPGCIREILDRMNG